MLLYATPEDLTPDWMPAAPTNAASLIRSASRLVRRATLTAYYATDAAGAPTAVTVVQAMRDATCAQVASWVEADISPLAGAAKASSAPVASKSLGSASVSYDTSAAASVTAMAARAAAATSLCQEAGMILAEAGLIGTRPEAAR